MRPLGAWTFPVPGMIAERHLYFSVEVDPRARATPTEDGSALERAAAIFARSRRRRARALPARRHSRRQDRARPAEAGRRPRRRALEGRLGTRCELDTRRAPRLRRAQALLVAQMGRGGGRRPHRRACSTRATRRCAACGPGTTITPRRSKRCARRWPTSGPRSPGSDRPHDFRVDGRCDLVVTVGGDGTLLGASHGIGPGRPLARRQQRAGPLGRVLLRRAKGPGARGRSLPRSTGTLERVELTRMRVELNGERSTTASSTRRSSATRRRRRHRGTSCVLVPVSRARRSRSETHERPPSARPRRRGAEVERPLGRSRGGLDGGAAERGRRGAAARLAGPAVRRPRALPGRTASL